MKVCNYCHTIQEFDRNTCPSCGSTDFSFKCQNCGNISQHGQFCPSCGIRFGEQAKACPDCATRYFTNACPNCGYTKFRATKSQQTTEASYVKEEEASKINYEQAKTETKTSKLNQASGKSRAKDNKKIIIQALLWIFLFPLMLIYWPIKNRNKSKGYKIIAWTILLPFTLLVLLWEKLPYPIWLKVIIFLLIFWLLSLTAASQTAAINLYLL